MADALQWHFSPDQQQHFHLDELIRTLLTLGWLGGTKKTSVRVMNYLEFITPTEVFGVPTKSLLTPSLPASPAHCADCPCPPDRTAERFQVFVAQYSSRR